jgi:hypothetical protein
VNGATTLARRSPKTAAAAAFALLAVACGGGGAAGGTASPSARASSPSPAPAAAICQDLVALRASLAPLSPEQIKARPGMVAAGLEGVQTALTALAHDVHGHLQAQVGALKSATAQLKSQVKKLTASPGSQEAAAVRAALAGVTAAVQQLLNSLGTRCASAESSQSPG